jgi:hypothetical protein
MGAGCATTGDCQGALLCCAPLVPVCLDFCI